MSYQKLSIFFLLFLLILTLTGCFGNFFNTPSLEDQTGTIYLDTDNLQPVPGEDLTLKLATTNINDFKAYSVTLSYDPALLQLESVTEGDFFSSEGQTFFYPAIDNQQGSVLIDCAILGRNVSVSGEGTLANLSFTCLKDQPGEIVFKVADIRDTQTKSLTTTQRNILVNSR
jgi:hypothetical protein